MQFQYKDPTTRNNNGVTTVPIPTAAIIIICVSIYVFIIFVFYLIRRYLKSKEMCDHSCVSNFSCDCGCCSKCVQLCDCQLMSCDKCLDSCCPRKKLHVSDIFFCLRQEGICSNGMCNCQSGCENIKCGCCEISIRNTSMGR